MPAPPRTKHPWGTLQEVSSGKSHLVNEFRGKKGQETDKTKHLSSVATVACVSGEIMLILFNDVPFRVRASDAIAVPARKIYRIRFTENSTVLVLYHSPKGVLHRDDI